SMYFPNTVTILPGSSLILRYSELQFAPNTSLIVSPGAYLIMKGTHLYSCGPQMWNGISVQGNAIVIADSLGSSAYNLIEDAKIAIDWVSPTNNTQALTLSNTTFNKNHIDIHISNYTQPLSTYPFSISNCVFTCRDLPFTSTSWPTTSSVSGLRTPVS